MKLGQQRGQRRGFLTCAARRCSAILKIHVGAAASQVSKVRRNLRSSCQPLIMNIINCLSSKKYYIVNTNVFLNAFGIGSFITTFHHKTSIQQPPRRNFCIQYTHNHRSYSSVCSTKTYSAICRTRSYYDSDMVLRLLTL